MIEVAVRIVFSLAVVLLLMWLLAKVARRPLSGRNGGALSVLARQPLSRGAQVAVVRVADRAYLVGVTDQSVTLLAETDPAAVELAAHPTHEVREKVPLESLRLPFPAFTPEPAPPGTSPPPASGTSVPAGREPDAPGDGPPATPATPGDGPPGIAGLAAAEPSALRGSGRNAGPLAGSILSPSTWRQAAVALRRGHTS